MLRLERSIRPGIIAPLATLVLVGLVFTLAFVVWQGTSPDQQTKQATQLEESEPLHTNPEEDYDGWQRYTSTLGYSIMIPPGWFAGSDPSIGSADILYEHEDFPVYRSGDHGGEYSSDTSSANFIVVNREISQRRGVVEDSSVYDGADSILSTSSVMVGGNSGILSVSGSPERQVASLTIDREPERYHIYARVNRGKKSLSLDDFTTILSTLRLPPNQEPSE
jgi:hypothetical protein